MAVTPSELRAAMLIRPRRFLRLMSHSHMSFDLLGVEVKEEASYNGFVLTLHRHERVLIGLWVVGFAVWRFGTPAIVIHDLQHTQLPRTQPR
jgi:hypothetical protein